MRARKLSLRLEKEPDQRTLRGHCVKEVFSSLLTDITATFGKIQADEPKGVGKKTLTGFT